ncbi:MAG: hypothetical protein HZC40_14935 [Chloroflexi bacterium]|nr:hypothetical protein [Chloroflexota bacterium]
MKKLNPYVALFLIALAFRVGTALPLQQAGYMDAAYTMHIAEQLARGRGFVEEVLWNYLDNPAGLPHPSNVYWMPLSSLLIAPLFVLFGASYRVAQIPFIFLSALLPVFAFYLSRKIFSRDPERQAKGYAWSAALFTLFSGFYTIYWVSPDNFTVFAITGSITLFLIARGIEESGRANADKFFFLAGIFAGLSHLARADGILFLVIAPIAFTFFAIRNSDRVSRIAPRVLRLTFFSALGYLLIMLPWFARNTITFGALFPIGGAKTLWLTHYDELFRFTDDLTPARYFAWGLEGIVGSKVNAAIQNAFILAFSSLVFFLAPFSFIGWWKTRQHIYHLPITIYLILLYLVMTLGFTFPSWRGSLFHSASALAPFFAITAPLGIDASVEWIARRRRAWNLREATQVFRFGFVILAALFSVYLYAQAIWGASSGVIPLWNQRDAHYTPIARWLDQNARADDLVMVVDPPMFYTVSHRRAIVIPTENVDALFIAARKYNARYVIVEFDHPRPFSDLYNERVTVPGLKRVADFRDALNRPAFVFEIVP